MSLGITENAGGGKLTSHCCFCSMQCRLELHPTADHGSYTIKPSPDFPVATGRLCQKGFHAMTHTVHPERVLEPRQKSGQGGWRQAKWEEALNGIASEIMRIQQTYGADAVSVYGGGSLTNEVCYLLGKFARVALGTRYIDYNGRYCMSSAAAAQSIAFGLDRGLTFPLEDLPEAGYLILAGTNIAECQPMMMPYLLAAKKRGAIIVTIDPRNTMTSKVADIHVRLQPGFDSVLVAGLLHCIVNEQLYDAEFVEQRTTGFAELAEVVAPFPPERVQDITGIPKEVIRTIARGFAKAKTGVVMTARGLEQQVNGVEHTLQYINLCLLTGKIGRPGCGFGSVTGQANGQGGREHGQKADQLPGYRSIEDPEARKHVAAVWGIDPDRLPGKGVSAYELIGKAHSGEIKAMIVLGSNPVVSSPNSQFAEEALRRLELLVVIDLFETETASFAHWLLPGSSFLEAEGTLTNVEGRVFHRPAAFKPPGESRLDMHILCDLADRLGKGSYFRFEHVEQVFEELTRASAGGKADYAGLTYNRLKTSNGLFWPCPTSAHPGTPRLFVDRFAHPDGRARLAAVTPGLPAERPDREYPFLLTTGRLSGHYLSGAQTRRTAELMRKAPVPVAELHPIAAQRIGLRVNDRLRLTSRRGSIVLPVRVTEDIHPTAVFVPFHWGGEWSINRLTHDALHPISKMPEFKLCAVKLERVE